jgi:hypothetical protein
VDAPGFTITSDLVSAASGLTSFLSVAVSVEVYVKLLPLLVHARLDLEIPIEIYVKSQPLLVHSRLKTARENVSGFTYGTAEIPIGYQTGYQMRIDASDRPVFQTSATFGEQDLWLPVGQTVDR